MTELRVKPHARDAEGRVLTLSPADAGWTHVGFEIVQLRAGETLDRATGEREIGAVMLSGRAHATTAETDWGEIGERMDVFEKTPAYIVYAPRDERIRLEAITDVEVALCSAPSDGNHPARLIRPTDIETMNRGSGSMRRRVHNLLPETEPADSLLLVEVYTPAGNWSSYPPHKHDTDEEGVETQLEETYYHRVNPPHGFALQRVYTADRSLDESVAVEHGECVTVPYGYHMVGAPAGYEVYYLNVMAGPKRQWLFTNDPTHNWLFEGLRSSE